MFIDLPLSIVAASLHATSCVSLFVVVVVVVFFEVSNT